jgi:hypothetical protein
MGVTDLLNWFAGGPRGYMTLLHCMRHDTLWIAITVFLDLTVATGYCLIALHWWRNERDIPDSPAKQALGRMKNIFIFCGLCGYLFIPLKMFWPAWRLYDLFMTVLAYNTWRYAWSARELRVVYGELGRTTELASANAELSRAYEATIEGWARALDLRDKETEGHSRRVTEMTMALARTMGFGPKELEHVRRGALLHDIGKMGIPDSILLKPGPLTDEERAIMQRHPLYAFDWLSPITFLHPALDIPYCHHERWDGTGYPRGLAGDDIPLAARIFAAVDIWDALSNDRPYRGAWPPEQTVAHIRSLAGSHLEPRVVDAFLQVILSEPTTAMPLLHPGDAKSLTQACKVASSVA